MKLIEFKFNDKVAYINPKEVLYLTPVDENNTHIEMSYKRWIEVGEPIKEVALKLANFKKECSVCGSEEHEWTAHMNQITKNTGFGLWERVEGGFMCGVCNRISPKPTRFCGYCGKQFTGVLAKTEEELFLNDH